jgi:nitrogen regulatory protein P-II 1
MSSGPIAYLTDAVQITAVVPVGRADVVLKAARDVGATAGIVHLARGTGARERLGLLAIAVEAEKEVLNIIVATEHQQLVAEAMYRAGGLGVPGGGYLYVTPLERVATYLPQEALDRLQMSDHELS